MRNLQVRTNLLRLHLLQRKLHMCRPLQSLLLWTSRLFSDLLTSAGLDFVQNWGKRWSSVFGRRAAVEEAVSGEAAIEGADRLAEEKKAAAAAAATAVGSNGDGDANGDADGDAMIEDDAAEV